MAKTKIAELNTILVAGYGQRKATDESSIGRLFDFVENFEGFFYCRFEKEEIHGNCSSVIKIIFIVEKRRN